MTVSLNDIGMVDTTTLDVLRGQHPQAIAGYLDGAFADIAGIERMFPELTKAGRIVSIVVSASDDRGIALDVENGDATPEQAPGWVKRAIARGVFRPILYANRSTMPRVIVALERAGIARVRVRLWVADWTGFVHIPPGFDACQYENPALIAGHPNEDKSVCEPWFFAGPEHRPPEHKPAPLDYSRYPEATSASPWGHNSPREVAKQYDQARKHEVLHHAEVQRLRLRCAFFAGVYHEAPHRWLYEHFSRRARGEQVK